SSCRATTRNVLKVEVMAIPWLDGQAARHREAGEEQAECEHRCEDREAQPMVPQGEADPGRAIFEAGDLEPELWPGLVAEMPVAKRIGVPDEIVAHRFLQDPALALGLLREV